MGLVVGTEEENEVHSLEDSSPGPLKLITFR